VSEFGTIIQTCLNQKQTSLKNNSNFFERLDTLCQLKSIAGITELAKKMGYSSPEKLYRLNRIKPNSGDFNNPSFDILVDLANMFEDLNMRWLITGRGKVLLKEEPIQPIKTPFGENNLFLNEEEAPYLAITKSDVNKIVELARQLPELIKDNKIKIEP
jgi:hypothetical protein